MYRRQVLRVMIGSGVAIAAGQASGIAPLLGRAAASSGDQQRTVNVDRLNLRNGPGLDYSVITVLSRGDIVSIAGGTQWADGYEWVKVAVWGANTAGWVASEFIGVSSEPVPAGAEYVVAVSALDLRSGAGLRHDVNAGLSYGMRVTATGDTAAADGYTWYLVDVPEIGLRGWVASSLLEPASSGGNPSPFEPGSYVHVNVDALHLRVGAGLDHAVIATYPYRADAMVTGSGVTADGYTWVPVRMADGTHGWFAGEYLAPGYGEIPKDRVRVAAGPLRVRSEPSLSGEAYYSAPVGAYGTIMDPDFVEADGYTWIYVQLDANAVIGWMALEFMSYIDVA